VSRFLKASALTLRNMLELVDEPLDSRIVSYLNMAPVNDGGQWDMAVNLIGMSLASLA
jgi:bleomycin hydrolase